MFAAKQGIKGKIYSTLVFILKVVLPLCACCGYSNSCKPQHAIALT